MGGKRSKHGNYKKQDFSQKIKEKGPNVKPIQRLEDNIKMSSKDILLTCGLILTCGNCNGISGVIECEKFLSKLSKYISFSRCSLVCIPELYV